jgi:hypothetical protein
MSGDPVAVETWEDKVWSHNRTKLWWLLPMLGALGLFSMSRLVLEAG